MSVTDPKTLSRNQRYYRRHRERILAQQKDYRTKRPDGRMSDCHPDRRNHGNGQCKRCYQREWFRKYGYTPKPKKPPTPEMVVMYPQAVVRVPVKGWGCL